MKKTKQQTAVEWLVNEIAEKYNFRFETYYGQEIQQAKEMEKQQIIDAYKEGCFDSILDEKTDIVRAEQFYNNTFKK